MNNENNLQIIDFYKSVESSKYYELQAAINTAPSTIENVYQYEQIESVSKAAAKIIQEIERIRKLATQPLDNEKSRIMEIEKASTLEFKKFIEASKKAMLEFNAERERIQREANEKLRQEATEQLNRAAANDISGIMATFTDKINEITLETGQIKNVRKTLKARVTNQNEIDWNIILTCLFSAGLLDPESLLQNLPKAMKLTGVTHLKGIELYEHKTQVLR